MAEPDKAAPTVEPSTQEASKPEEAVTQPAEATVVQSKPDATDTSDKPETTDDTEQKVAAENEGAKIAEILGEPKTDTNLDILIKRIASTKKVEAAESDISDSEDEDELIANVQEWDITFKLAPYLDNHFILPLLNHVKDRKKRALQQRKQHVAGDDDDAKDEKRDDAVSENKPKIANDASLVAEQLFSLFDDDTLNQAEFELLSKTCLIDEQLDLVETLKHSQSGERTRSLADYKRQVLSKLEQLEEMCGPLIDFLGDEKSVTDLAREKAFRLSAIQEKQPTFDAASFQIDNLYAYCRLRYEVGFYHDTDVLLGYYRMLTPDLHKKHIALWGQLSAQILQNKWDDAFRVIRDIRENIDDNLRTLNLGKGEENAAEEDEEEDYLTKRLKELEEAAAEDDDDDDDDAGMTLAAIAEEKPKPAIDNAAGDSKTASVQIASIMRDRAWLLHWSLFVFFNKDTLLDEMTNFFAPKYMNVIQTMCPHLLRYLTAAILISPTFDKSTKLKYLTDVSKILIEEQSRFSDPITEFVRLVIRTNDFEGASTMLRYAIEVIKCDFFLAYYHDYFVQFARTTFLIKYCRLHSRVCVPKIAALLLMDEMSTDEQQLWLINAIRSESINAKLDVVENVIYVHFGEANPYHEMKDRIKAMNHRTVQLYKQIKHKEELLNTTTE